MLTIQNPELVSLLQQFNRQMSAQKRHNAEVAKIRKLQNIAKMEADLRNATLEISVLYWDSAHIKAVADTFEIEGLRNGEMIFSHYRKNGFSKNLKSICMSVAKTGKVIKKVTFEY
jgi:hypothetical protein